MTRDTFTIRGVCPSARDWREAGGVAERHRIRDAKIIHRDLPASLLRHRKLSKLQVYVAPPAEVWALPHGVTVGAAGAISVGDGVLLLSSVNRFFSSAHERALLEQSEFSLRTVEGVGALLTAPGSCNWSHALCDVLPRTWQIRCVREFVDQWIVPVGLPSSIWDLLSLAGVRRTDCLEIGPGEALRADLLLVPRPSGFAPFPAPWVRDAVLDVVGPPKCPCARLIVSREAQNHRKWVEEADAGRLLAKHGFELVLAETLTVEQQVERFRHSAIILGAHGAGLANAIMAPAGCWLVEVAPAKLVHPDYWGLSRLSQGHWMRVSPPDDVPFSSDDDIHISEFSVAPANVVKAIEPALATG